MSIDEQWQINEKWLDDVISRNDVIRAVSNPLEKSNIFYDTSYIPDNVFDTPQNLKSFLLNLNAQQISKLGFYGKEVRKLFMEGYNYSIYTKKFSK